MSWRFYDESANEVCQMHYARRLGTEDDNVVILVECQPNVFHGYVSDWGELSDAFRIQMYEVGRCTTMRIKNNGK